jgi:hypothetical protein
MIDVNEKAHLNRSGSRMTEAMASLALALMTGRGFPCAFQIRRLGKILTSEVEFRFEEVVISEAFTSQV